MRTSGNLSAWNTDKLTLYSVNRLLNNSDTPLVELSNDWNSNSKTFIYATGTNRACIVGSRGTNYNLYTIPANSTFRLLTFTDNHSLTPATSEINVYINNVLQTKTQVATTDQNFVYDTAYPLNILARNAGASASSNAILTTLAMSINEDNTTQRTSIYNAIRGFNNNAF